jgi:hypothetical protein
MRATCPLSASSGYHAELHEGCYQKHTNPLNCRTSSSDIPGYHADFHEVVVQGPQTSRLARCTSQQNLLVASRCHFSYNGRVSVASEACESVGIFCIPRSVFRYDSCVPVASHAAGGQMEPVEVDKVIRSEKRGKNLVLKGFGIRFQKNYC